MTYYKTKEKTDKYKKVINIMLVNMTASIEALKNMNKNFYVKKKKLIKNFSLKRY